MGVASSGSRNRLFELFDLGVLAEQGLDAWLRLTLDRCAKLFEASGGSVFLCEIGGAAMLRAKAGGQRKLEAATKIEPGVGIGGAVLMSGKPMLVGDPENDPFFMGTHFRRREDVASSMVVPLHDLRGEVLGLMNLSRGSAQAPFDDRDLRQATSVGRHLALAVANARLMDQLRDSLAESRVRNAQLHAVLGGVRGTVCVVGADGVAESPGQSFPRGPRPLRDAVLTMTTELVARRLPATSRVIDPDSGRSWTVEGILMPGSGGVLTIHEVTSAMAAQAETSRLRHLAEVGQVAAALAHEIRNPLTGIRAAAQMIAEGTENPADFASIVRDEADRLNDLCQEILDYAKPVGLRLEPTRLGETVGRAVRLAERSGRSQGIDLRIDVPSRERPIALDSRKVQQVVINLVQNAIEASPPGGCVEVRVRGTNLTVSDEGPGISEHAMPRLFTPFFTTRRDGTGLGLSMVRKIVEAHGGGIRVDTAANEGTRFTVDFCKRIA